MTAALPLITARTGSLVGGTIGTVVLPGPGTLIGTMMGEVIGVAVGIGAAIFATAAIAERVISKPDIPEERLPEPDPDVTRKTGPIIMKCDEETESKWHVGVDVGFSGVKLNPGKESKSKHKDCGRDDCRLSGRFKAPKDSESESDEPEFGLTPDGTVRC